MLKVLPKPCRMLYCIHRELDIRIALYFAPTVVSGNSLAALVTTVWPL